MLTEEGLEFASRRVGNVEALNPGRMSEKTPYGLFLYVRADGDTVNVLPAALASVHHAIASNYEVLLRLR